MSILFEQVQLKGLTLKNRFVRSATNAGLSDTTGNLADEEFAVYRMLAQNNVGLIITGHTYVQHPIGRASANQNGFYDDRFIEKYKKLAAAVHAYGSKLIIQISCAGRQTNLEATEGQTPLAPSPVCYKRTGITPAEMTTQQIEEMIDAFTAAIARARQTGADGVQLHIAHGYALAQFLSPYTNHRKDQWGGSVENRTRIIKEILMRSQHCFDEQFLLLAKLNSTDGYTGPEYLTLDDVIYAARLLEKYGAATIEISGGIVETRDTMSRPGVFPPEQEACFASAAQAVKQAVSLPIILVGGLRSLSVMEQLVEDKCADLVALSRPFIKQPDLVNRLQSEESKSSCISCNACLQFQGLLCHMATETAIELRGFGKMTSLFKERGWSSPREVKIPGLLTGYGLLRLLKFNDYPIEVVFINGKAHQPADVIHPGDRVSLVPPGTPGPHRVLLGFVKSQG